MWVGGGMQGRGEKWGKMGHCNSIINKIYLKTNKKQKSNKNDVIKNQINKYLRNRT